MITIKGIIQELDFLSDRISTQVRTVAVSLIIVTWGLLLGTSSQAIVATCDFRRKLLIVGTLAILTLFCDFLQYFFGYLNANSLRKTMEKQRLEESLYDYRDWRYRLRGFFFWFKQAVLILTVIWFLVIIIPCLVG